MRSLMILALSASVLFASEVLPIKKGWQLIGVATELDVEKVFNTKDVEIVWSFNAQTQTWSGYSSDENISEKIAQNYTDIDTLKSYQALWVLSKEDWQLEYEPKESKEEAINSTIALEIGWNLVALPQRTVVSDSFFGDALVWRYSEEGNWSVNAQDLDFPSIEAITESEGVWVKSDVKRDISVEEEGAKLHTFNSKEDMLEYIRKMTRFNNYNYPYYDDVVAVGLPVPEVVATDSGISGTVAPTSGTSGSDVSKNESAENATTTNLQEEGVDEADILKHDGTYIFSVDNQNAKIFVSSFSKIAEQNYDAITSIDVKGKNIVAMYLQQNRLTLISNVNEYYALDAVKPIAGVLPPVYRGGQVGVDVYDVSDIKNIKKITSHKVDGYYQESRLIDAELYLVTSYSPQVQYEYPKVYATTVCSKLNTDEIFAQCSYSTSSTNEQVVSAEGDVISITPSDSSTISSSETPILTTLPMPPIEKEVCTYGKDYKVWNKNSCYQYQYDNKGAWKYDYTNPIVVSERLIPTITSDSNKAIDLLTPSTFYAPNKLNQSANITSISHFDTRSGSYKNSSAFIGNTSNYYASSNAFYLVSNEYPRYYDYIHFKEQQMIYRFTFDESLSFSARGSVDGRLLNQFSMSEKDGYLRVATTSGQSWFNGGGTDNSVYTLKVEDKNLKVAGTLHGLGHKGESIKAVRFMGDRGFVVTFRQKDPLYTLDMSDAQNPSVVGELSIPGFSSYLHVVDENRVLSVGRDADAEGRVKGLQLQLFDVSDFSNPRLADKIVIGERSTYSEAEYNSRAFSYRASDLMFGIPYTSYDYSNSISNGYSENFGIYQVDGLKILAKTTLSSSERNWGNVGRGLIFDLNNTSYGALLKGSNVLAQEIKEISNEN